MEDLKLDQMLVAHGFEPYVPLFHAHAIRSDVLADLTSEDLLDAGVASLGHRIRLLRLFETASTVSSTVSSAPSSATGPSSTNLPALANAAHASTYAQNSTQHATQHATHSTQHAAGQPLGQSTQHAHSTHSAGQFSSTPSPAEPSREVVYLRQRIDTLDKQVRRLHELVTRLRADMFRQRKEGEPLPTPGRNASPVTLTPSITPSMAASVAGSSASTVAGASTGSTPGSTTPGGGPPRKSPMEGYFSRPTQFPGSALPSPSTHAHSHHYREREAGHGNSHIVISSQLELTKLYRCSEHDNAARVLSAIRSKMNLDGDASQWRLQLLYADKTRDLLDHEYPLLLFKQLQDQGHAPAFSPRRIQPHKPPVGSFI